MVDFKLNNIEGTPLEENDSLLLLIDQLQMLFFTRPGDVLGEPELGIDLRNFLWETNLSNFELEKYAKYQINKYILMSKLFDIKVKVRLIHEDITDTAFIDVIINDIPVMGVYVK